MLILIYNFEGERKHREEIASLKGSRQPLERRPAWDFFFFFFVPSLKVVFSFVEERNLAHFGNAKPGCCQESFAGVINKTCLLQEIFIEVKWYAYNFDTIRQCTVRVIWQKKEKKQSFSFKRVSHQSMLIVFSADVAFKCSELQPNAGSNSEK